MARLSHEQKRFWLAFVQAPAGIELHMVTGWGLSLLDFTVFHWDEQAGSLSN